jgi:exosortase K
VTSSATPSAMAAPLRVLTRVKPWTAAVLTLGCAYALKRFYSQAGAAELEWVLAPSCWLASLGGVPLAHEPGAGFISHGARMVVGASCAGVNFLITAWLALFFTGHGHAHVQGRLHRTLAWSAASLLAAYALTIATNGLRILFAAHFYGAELHAGFLTPARVHRLLGVVLYCGALIGACAAAARMLGASTLSPLARLAPFLWYLAVVIGVPLVNRAWLADPARFAEHAALTCGAGALVVVLARLGSSVVDRLCSRSDALW